MDGEMKNPLVDDSLAAESTQGTDDAAGLPRRLARYSEAHHRALQMADYAVTVPQVNKVRWRRLGGRLKRCGSYLAFRHYFRIDQVKLHAAEFCQLSMLCPLCAIRRGAKFVEAYRERFEALASAHPTLNPYFVTLTVRDGEDLMERMNHLRWSLRRMGDQRRNAAKGLRDPVEYSKSHGAVWSYEVKRGKGSGQWHPHVHCIWLCETPPDGKKLSEEWHAITGDSFIVDVRPCYGDSLIDAMLEVFKYALKFSDLDLADNWVAALKLKGARMVASSGILRGVPEPEALEDDEIIDEPFVELFFRFAEGAGYSLVHDGFMRVGVTTPYPRPCLVHPRSDSGSSDLSDERGLTTLP